MTAVHDSSGAILRVSHIWHGEVLADRVLRRRRAVTIGPDRRATFVTPRLPMARKSRLKILRRQKGTYAVALGRGMTGTLTLAGSEVDVASLVSGAGLTLTPVEPGDAGVVHLDSAHTLFFHFVERGREVPKGVPFRDLELFWAALALITFGFVVLFLLCFLIYDPNASQLVFPGSRALVAEYLAERPELSAPGTKTGAKVAPSSTEGDPGKAGGHGKKPRRRAPDPQPQPAAAEPDEEIPEAIEKGFLTRTSRQKINKVIATQAMDDRLAKSLAALAGRTNHGGRGSGSGRGSGAGAGHGTGTLTRGGRGGRGGGGHAHTDVITQHAIDTGGVRAARGRPEGKGLREVAVSVKVGHASGTFNGLSRDQIKRVVMSRRNAIRACYESQLQRTRGLGGKVVVRWRIAPTGAVAAAKVASTTMHNGPTEDCIVRQVRAMRFPASRGTSLVTFPFFFEAGG